PCGIGMPVQSARRDRLIGCEAGSLAMTHDGLEPVPATGLAIKSADVDGMMAPVIAESGHPVAEIVNACHEMPIDAALAPLAVPGLDRTTLEPLLTYCAEERCVEAKLACPGCRHRTQMTGVASLDEFIARFREIVLRNGAGRIEGRGQGSVQ